MITGGAGFIGSTLADRLSGAGIEVVIYDNLSRGRREFIAGALERAGVELVEGDVLDGERLRRSLEGCDTVFHLAANADVRHGFDRPTIDLEQNTIATSVLLEAMRAADVRRIAFSSTGSVYGEPEVFPTPETCPFPVQTSLYGASKLAGEALIQAYAHGYGFTGIIFRFVSILGERYTHGHVFDFLRSLRDDPTCLRVLGNGRQEKSYLYVGDCVSAMTLATDHAVEQGIVHVFNLGTDETIVVDDSIATIAERLGVAPELEYTGGARGWLGDSPLIHLDCSRIRALGWQPTLSIADGDPADGRLAPAEPVGARGACGSVSVVFTRAPLRVSLGGGGTDVSSYYREAGGFLVGGAIDKYVYMLTHTVFQRRYRMKYSQFEEVDEPSEIRHPILRESLLRHWNGDPLEVSVIADVPAGTGLGSSGAFTVCFLKALALARRVAIPPGRLAEDACEIEIDVLREPTGKQDQYVSAHGGICAYTFNRDGSVDVEPLVLARRTLERLRDNLLLFYTGEARSASAILADQVMRTESGDEVMRANLDRTKEMGFEVRSLLERGEVEEFGALMHEHWLNKQRRSPGMATERIEHLYTLARRSGVSGGKVVGAGGGGFLLVYARRPDDTRQAMAAAGAPELHFDFEFQGCTGAEYT